MDGFCRYGSASAALLLLFSGAMARAQVALPQEHAIERYAAIWQKAPFVAATDVSPAAESIARRFAVTGFARVGGNDVIFVFDRKGLGRFTVAKGMPGNGVELLEVTEGLQPKDLKAKIRAEGETAEIVFDPTLMADSNKGDNAPKPPVAAAPSETAEGKAPGSGAVLSGSSAVSDGPANPPRAIRVIRRTKPISAQ